MPRALSLSLALLVLSGAAGAHDQDAHPDPAADARHLEALRQRIAGREEEPAGKVFQNVPDHEHMPAGRLLRIMETGYTRSLGVSCAYCHDPEHWDSDAKEHKKTAREMSRLMKSINAKLREIPGIAEDDPTVNCTTCHRGQTQPALTLDPAAD